MRRYDEEEDRIAGKEKFSLVSMKDIHAEEETQIGGDTPLYSFASNGCHLTNQTNLAKVDARRSPGFVVQEPPIPEVRVDLVSLAIKLNSERESTGESRFNHIETPDNFLEKLAI